MSKNNSEYNKILNEIVNVVDNGGINIELSKPASRVVFENGGFSQLLIDLKEHGYLFDYEFVCEDNETGKTYVFDDKIKNNKQLYDEFFIVFYGVTNVTIHTRLTQIKQ